ncbi:MAG: glycosyltransferase family 4 protein [Thermoleophilia bacterium]|nr:glycosyltransferase family 4 protein [Thermoleophilia bacterium]
MSSKPRVLVLSEIPTPYRLPLYRRIAEVGEVELEIAFCAETQPDRPWSIDEELGSIPHRILRGFPLTRRSSRNTFVYEVNPSVVPLLVRGGFDLLVIGGYAVFAEQVAIAYARVTRRPYLLHVESHLGKPRSDAVARAKSLVLPHVIGAATGGLAVGSAARRYLQAYGLARHRIHILPNTIDVDAYSRAAQQVRNRASEIRRDRDLPERYLLFVGRLVGAKGVSDLLGAHGALGQDAPPLLVAGEGPLRNLVDGAPNVRLLGFQDTARLIELYALAQSLVVPSHDEPWGVVVNEALACGTPVIASSAVGAAEDLIRDGLEGRVVPSGDVPALARAMSEELPRVEPQRSPIGGWTYEFGVQQFHEAVASALSGRAE